MVERQADQARLEYWLWEINRRNDTPGRGITRQYLTDTDWDARLYIRNEMERMGLYVEMDSVGNLLATLPGTEPDLAPVWTGSHFDSVLHGGPFDGVAGVVAGMEAVRMVQSAGIPHRRNLTVVAYAGEEPARFGIGCIGSRAMAGCLSEEDLTCIRSPDGRTLRQELLMRGLDPDCLASCRKKTGDVFCALELHIEQGGLLIDRQIPLGIVKSICAPTDLNICITGQAAHAGGMPMDQRRDALSAASEMCLALEHIARSSTLSEYCTGTVGCLRLFPNAPNVIPGVVEFTVDIRDCCGKSKTALRQQVETCFKKIAQRRSVELEITLQNDDEPVCCHPALRSLLADCCTRRGVPSCSLISGAFHDSLFLGKIAPVGMLFVPSEGGLSHCPQEKTDMDAIKRGTEVLADALLRLSNMDVL